MEGSGLCYHTLEAWARGSGFSAWVLTLEILNIYTCSQARGMGGFQAFCPSSLLYPDGPEALPMPQVSLRFAGLAADLTGVSIWGVRGESGVEVALVAVCLDPWS